MADVKQFQAEPIVAAGTLADRVTEILLQKINSGEFAVHSRLPSEQLMTERFGVSRTVIREAVSRLKSAGLVETRQGSGTVVVEPSAGASFRIEVDVKHSLQAVLHVVELRRGLEAEIAALAAARRSDAQCAHIKQALHDIELAVLAGGDGVEEDFAFHTAISEATGNPLYTALLQFLSESLRAAVTLGRINAARRENFTGQLKAEHSAIVDAIERQDVAAARDAARRHLDNVAERIHAADDGFWKSEGGQVARTLARSTAQMNSAGKCADTPT